MGGVALSSHTDAGAVRSAPAEVAEALGHEHRARLIERLLQGPPKRPTIANCRGRYWVLSFEVVAGLRTRGVKAWRLEVGFRDRKAASSPVEVVV